MSDFYEDVVVGQVTELGSYLFTGEEIVAFARAFDPQSFHLDAEAARTGPFGALAASGWHTAAVWMKLNVAQRQRDADAALARGEGVALRGPSPGFRDLRWIRPVLAGDTIRFAVEVLAKRPVSRPGWGMVLHRGTGANQHGQPVFSFDGAVLWQLRPARGRAGVSAPQTS